jgi:outer membrane protein assembly factor BamA
MIRRFVRFVLSGEVDGTHKDTQHAFFVAGGDTGLRGYAIGEFQGPAMMMAHAELRTAPLAVVSQRFGGVLFADAGDAATAFSTLVMRADAGVGLRWLIPQLNASVIRFDYAVAFVDGDLTAGGTRAGFPGRFSAGFQQIF